MEEKDSDDRGNRSAKDNSKAPSNGGDEIRGGKVDEFEGERQVVSCNLSSDCAVDNSSSGEIKRVSKSETLPSLQIAGGDFSESSSILSEVPVKYSVQPMEPVEETKDQVSHEESLKAVTDKSTQVQIQKQIHVPSGQPKVELSPISVTQSISSNSSPVPPEQKSQSIGSGRNMCLSEEYKQNSPGPKSLSSVPMPKTPSDGYNWRKYGQKQVKSPEGSRSYYRCTFSHCQAKKIECSGRFNRTLETVYRSQHNHEPPQKVNSTRENRSALPTVPINGNDNPTCPEAGVNDPMHSTTSKEPVRAIDQMLEAKQQESSDSDETMEMDLKEEYVDGLESRRRKRNSSAEVASVPKTGKKAKFVVHAAGDVGISGDGYRWRKYGQKMVKGNPHPRNYYRCTSAGCPVRKHIEKAVDNTNAVLITYKGVHGHDTPVPKKRNGPKNSLVVAASPASSVNLQTSKTEKHKSQTQWSVGKEGELTGQALSADGEKTSESTRTLLSIGFEIKPC